MLYCEETLVFHANEETRNSLNYLSKCILCKFELVMSVYTIKTCYTDVIQYLLVPFISDLIPEHSAVMIILYPLENMVCQNLEATITLYFI